MIRSKPLYGAIAALLFLASCQSQTTRLRESASICAKSSEKLSKSEFSQQNIIFPADFIANSISGKSCTKNYHASRFDNDLRYIEELTIQNDSKLRQSTSLTVDHENLSHRWAKLLGNTYGVAASGNRQDAEKLVNSLVVIAKANTLLDSQKPNQTMRKSCWKDGSGSSKCPFHTSQHAGFTFIALLYSAIILDEYITRDDRSTLNKYFEVAYEQFIEPMAFAGKGPNRGFYEFGDYGLGVLAYANYTKDKFLAFTEIMFRKARLESLITNEGYIDNNSYRGVRSYWYHTLGVDSALGYALIARKHGIDFFRDPTLGNKLCRLAEKTLEGAVDYQKFMSKGFRGYNYSTNNNDERSHMHQLAVGLPLIIRKEYGISVPVSHRYTKLSRSETVDRFIGFNSDCYYESN